MASISYGKGSTFGSDASAAWGNGKTAHDDPNTKFLFFGKRKVCSPASVLMAEQLEPDLLRFNVLYGKNTSNAEIVASDAETPTAALNFRFNINLNSSSRAANTSERLQSPPLECHEMASARLERRQHS